MKMDYKQIKVLLSKLNNLYWEQITALAGVVASVFILLFALALKQWNLFGKLLFGLLFTTLVGILIRTFYFRRRPDKQEYHSYIERLDASSFPSWHTARIVFCALLFIYFFNNLYLTILFTFIAVSVMYSRMYLKRHDTYDVIAGVILGMITYWISMWW